MSEPAFKMPPAGVGHHPSNAYGSAPLRPGVIERYYYLAAFRKGGADLKRMHPENGRLSTANVTVHSFPAFSSEHPAKSKSVYSMLIQ
jgi:hypothetical protein